MMLILFYGMHAFYAFRMSFNSVHILLMLKMQETTTSSDFRPVAYVLLLLHLGKEQKALVDLLV